MVLKQKLRGLRTQAGLSVREAASQLGISPGYVSRIEGRGEIPSAEVLCTMAELYGTDIDELLALAKRTQLENAEKQIESRQNEALRLFRKSRKGP